MKGYWDENDGANDFDPDTCPDCMDADVCDDCRLDGASYCLDCYLDRTMPCDFCGEHFAKGDKWTVGGADVCPDCVVDAIACYREDNEGEPEVWAPHATAMLVYVVDGVGGWAERMPAAPEELAAAA